MYSGGFQEPEYLGKLPALGGKGGWGQLKYHSAVGPCLLPTPARGRGSYLALGGPCHLQSPVISGLWSSALGPEPHPPTAPQTSGPAGASGGSRPLTPAGVVFGKRAMIDRAQPENSCLPLCPTKSPSRPSPFMSWSEDKVAISGLARALAPVGKPLDEEDTF